jgi:hypothetical protein
VAGKYGARKGGLRVAILVTIGVFIIVGWVWCKTVKRDRESTNLPGSEGKESERGSESEDEPEGHFSMRAFPTTLALF